MELADPHRLCLRQMVPDADNFLGECSQRTFVRLLRTSHNMLARRDVLFLKEE
jgi:hypothetical protein